MIKAWWHTSKVNLDYLLINISVMSWPMVLIQGRWVPEQIFTTIHHRCFHNHWKVMIYVTVKICAAYNFLCLRKCVATSGNILCFLRNVPLLLKNINKVVNVQVLLNIFFVFKKMCGCFWKILRKCASDNYVHLSKGIWNARVKNRSWKTELRIMTS